MNTAAAPNLNRRLLDGVSAGREAGPLSVGLLTGSWRHTDPDPHGVHEVRIQGTAEELSVECLGNGALVPSSSPAVLASALFAANPKSRDGIGFFAEFDFGSMISRFQGNVNLGLLVLAGFHDFKDGSQRSNYFSREFFYAAPSLKVEPPVPGGSRGTGKSRLDTSSLLGFWRNTNSASAGVVTIETGMRGEELGVRAFGIAESGTLDWGETRACVYAKHCFSGEAMAFSAVFMDRGTRCHLQANVKQGVLVVAYFTEFNDASGRSNYFVREFYYKER